MRLCEYGDWPLSTPPPTPTPNALGNAQRTNMRTTTIAAKLGHMPQEDFPDALHEPLISFLRGEEPKTSRLPMMKMTKRGLEGA